MIPRYMIDGLIIGLLLLCLINVSEAQTNNSTAIPGNTTTATLMPINDGVLTGVQNSLINNNTSQINPGKALWYLSKEFTNVLGNWAIIIILGVVGGIIMYSQGGSPMSMIAAFMIGNVVIWAFVPFEWLGFISSLAIFALSCVIVAAVKGRQ